MKPQSLALNIFEPRYRLMVRRCLEGDRRFGMMGKRSQSRDRELGCEVQIVESRQLHDGRYHIQVCMHARIVLSSNALTTECTGEGWATVLAFEEMGP